MRFKRKILTICSLIYFLNIYSSVESNERKNYLSNNLYANTNKIVNSEEFETIIIKGFGETVDKATQDAAANALTKAVGSFIDVEKVVTDQQKINKEIIEFSQNMKIDIKEYSQGFIRFFEILNIEKKNNIYTVSAKVKIDKQEFSSYIREFSNSKSKFPGKNISAIIKGNKNNLDSSALIVADKIIEPLLERSVYEIEVGNVQLDQSNLVRVPVRIKINKNFLENIEDILSNISSDRFFSSVGSTYTLFPRMVKNAYLYEPSFNKSSKDIFVGILDKDRLAIDEFKIETSRDFEKLFANKNTRYCYDVKGSCGVTKYSLFDSKKNIYTERNNKQLITPLQISLLDINKKSLIEIICNLHDCYSVTRRGGKVKENRIGKQSVSDYIRLKNNYPNKNFRPFISFMPLDSKLSRYLNTPLDYSLVSCERDGTVGAVGSKCYLRIDKDRDYELILDLSPETLNRIEKVDIKFKNDYTTLRYDSKKDSTVRRSYPIKNCNKKNYSFKVPSSNNPRYLCITKQGDIYDQNEAYIGSTQSTDFKIYEYCYGSGSDWRGTECDAYFFEEFAIKKNILFKKTCGPHKKENYKYCKFKIEKIAERKKFFF